MIVTIRSSSSEFSSPALRSQGFVSQKEPVEQWTQYIPLVEVDIGLFADKVGVATTDTLDLSQGVHDLALAINVGVEETQNVLYTASQ